MRGILKGIVLAMGMGGCLAQAKPLAISAEGVEFSPPPTPSTVVHVLPSVVPGTYLIRQDMAFEHAPEMKTVCYYLVKGYSDSSQALLETLKAQNVLQFNCSGLEQK